MNPDDVVAFAIEMLPFLAARVSLLGDHRASYSVSLDPTAPSAGGAPDDLGGAREVGPIVRSWSPEKGGA